MRLRYETRRLVFVGLVLAATVAGCGNATDPTASPTVRSLVPRVSRSPAAVSTAASPSPARPAPPGRTVTDSHSGLRITFPSGWVVLVQSDARDPAAIAAANRGGAVEPAVIDGLAAGLRQRPEYWLAGSRASDSTVVTAELLPAANPGAWSSAELALLEQAFGYVLKKDVSVPRPGVVFSFVDQDFATSIYGFPRPGGVVVFTFTATSAYLGSGFDDIVATFRDERT